MATNQSRPIAVAGVVLLALVVIAGTAYGWRHWNDEIAQATDEPSTVVATASDSPTDEPSESSEPSESPTSDSTQGSQEKSVFEPIEATAGRDEPVVLVVGDRYADGLGATSKDQAWPERLARRYGWTVQVSAGPSPSYLGSTSKPGTLDFLLLLVRPKDVDPDLVIIEGGSMGPGTDEALTQGVTTLADDLTSRLPDTPVVVVTPFGATGGEAAAREKVVTKAWRGYPTVEIVRPSVKGWGDLPDVDGGTGDEGHRTIAENLGTALEQLDLV
ncbi:SGNH/GDSL hydrolase family protein [Nocardioides acrostichi]|uniref:SGNH/GDSL hydrolase family protein n=1 Tax=Nocardioides acrostichi TaxID=2784339 RepID=A0A930Y9B3_9ACTN|nr:SGNH/GDSL hydrolase family protein [Nocardioides acrostichi]MBF4163987.1 SGNH/GDSL hydrolase family protein [Nocardioides acrostichi]